MSTTGNNGETARRTLALFFGDQDAVTPEEVFQRAARIGKPKATNEHWFHNRTWILRQFGLVQADKDTVDGRMRTVRLRLTPTGKSMRRDMNKVMAESVTLPAFSSPIDSEARAVTLQSITDDVDEFNRQNPSWELEIIPKRIRKESLMGQR